MDMTSTGSVWPAAPEILLLASLCGILVIDLFLPPRWRHLTHGLSLLALAATAAAVLKVGQGLEAPLTAFSEMFVLDRLAVVLKVAVTLVSGVMLIYARDYLRARQLDADLVLDAGNDGADFGSPFHHALSRPGTDVVEPVCPGGVQSRTHAQRRGGHEVLRAGRHRVGDAALRHVHPVRRDGNPATR